ncbi:MAG: hypothetical protein V3R16_02370 [Nitrospirales bacterium]
MTPLFTNFCGIASSKEILQLQFGFQHRSKEGAVLVGPVVLLTITPSFLVQLRKVVATAIENHEEEHGPISDGSIVIPKAGPEVN